MDGVLLIDKPAGITSHDVVARVRKMIGERRIGHTGTLDPFATGLLVLLVGRATRLAQFLSGAEKEYEAVMRLGYATDTGDETGTRIAAESGLTTRHPHSLSRAEIESAMVSLRGEIEQIPPMYSAKKVQGRKLYELAREGQEVERQPLQVMIHEFELLSDEVRAQTDGSADLCFRVVCSAGTYVRTLAEDLGKQLRVPSHLAALRRTRAGAMKIDAAFSLESLAEVCKEHRLDAAIISPCDALSHLPAIELDDERRRRITNGVDFPTSDEEVPSPNSGDAVRLVQANELVAVGICHREKQMIHPAVVLTDR